MKSSIVKPGDGFLFCCWCAFKVLKIIRMGSSFVEKCMFIRDNIIAKLFVACLNVALTKKDLGLIP